MVAYEAFRISLGRIEFDRLVKEHHEKEIEYQNAIEQLLKPLKIGSRLNFYRHSNFLDGVDWLIVKIESSGQMSLLDWIDQEYSQDQELQRECGAAESLTRVALRTCRELISLSKVSPTQFHKLLKSAGEETEKALHIVAIAADHENEVVAIRNPQGHDEVVKVHAIPRRVTLPGVEEGKFLIDMVGRTSALVYRAEGKTGGVKPVGKKVELHWGRGPTSDALLSRFYSAMRARRAMTIRIRETLNRKGKVVRLEWCPDQEVS